ncbi:MAG: LamG domain-containing protein, partial [Sphingobacteriales bacterium]
MKIFNTYRKYCLAGLVLATATLSSCEKDGNPNELAELNPADYVGTVGGYRSSDEIIGNSLVAY